MFIGDFFGEAMSPFLRCMKQKQIDAESQFFAFLVPDSRIGGHSWGEQPSELWTCHTRATDCQQRWDLQLGSRIQPVSCGGHIRERQQRVDDKHGTVCKYTDKVAARKAVCPVMPSWLLWAPSPSSRSQSRVNAFGAYQLVLRQGWKGPWRQVRERRNLSRSPDGSQFQQIVYRLGTGQNASGRWLDQRLGNRN